MNNRDKAKAIKQQLIPKMGGGFTCKDWLQFGYVMKPHFQTEFEGQLSIAHKLRFLEDKLDNK